MAPIRLEALEQPGVSIQVNLLGLIFLSLAISVQAENSVYRDTARAAPWAPWFGVLRFGAGV